MTDRTGSLRLSSPMAGRYALCVRHVAFAACQSDPLQLQPGRTLEVAVRLGREAIPLEPLVVTARGASASRLAGFRERRSTETFGKFVSREEIDRRPAAEVSDFFRSMPGVFVVPVKRNGSRMA
ncbi:MAG: hypothetical protein ACRENP_07360 [Longimicrobiales bacterium]